MKHRLGTKGAEDNRSFVLAAHCTAAVVAAAILTEKWQGFHSFGISLKVLAHKSTNIVYGKAKTCHEVGIFLQEETVRRHQMNRRRPVAFEGLKT